jgi:hypothetical protein
MKRLTAPALALVAALGLTATQAAAANLITNGGFEDGATTSTMDGNTNTGVPDGWTPNAAFDLEPSFNHQQLGFANSGSYSLSIGNYDYEALAALSQTFSDVVGATYTGTFYAFDGGANGDSGAFLDASIDGTTLKALDDTVASYTKETFTFTGTGSDTFTIAAQTNPSEWFVDDVSIQGAGAVPEPASWAMMLLGVGAIGTLLRSRRSAAVARTAMAG